MPETARPDAHPPLKCSRGATVCNTFNLPARLSGDTLSNCGAIVSPIRSQIVTLGTTTDDAAVVSDVHCLAIETVHRAAEPPFAVAVEPDSLADLNEWESGAGVEEGAAKVVGSDVRFHCGTRGLHDAVASGYCGVKVLVVADEATRGLPGDGSGGRRAVGARGIVAGFVGHSEGEIGGEAGRFGDDVDVGVADGAVVALVAANARGGLGGNGAPVDTHGVEGVNECAVIGFDAAVGQDGVGEAPDGEPSQVQNGECVCAVDGGDDAVEAKVPVEAGHAQHRMQVRAQLEYVECNDAVEGERERREGVAGAAGQVAEFLARNAERATSRRVATSVDVKIVGAKAWRRASMLAWSNWWWARASSKRA